ncbi:hypothetical protein [Brevibacillus reuszeri]|uniref:hypothetical protein n=1 Tax=Brevibacillus reuszeri TaxID=54915 RepID=UPI000CCC55E4|nr:hypothetical protein [Brevibacillus reuszeri]
MFAIGDLLVEAIIALLQPILDFISNNTDTIMELVFNYNIEKDVSTGEVIGGGLSNLVYGLFSASELENLIKPGVEGMLRICALLLLLGVMYFGIRMARQGTNERLRSENMSMLFTMAFSMFLLGNIWILYDMMFLLNSIIVDTFRAMAFQKLNGSTFASGVDESSSAILKLVLSLLMLGLSLWANFYYIMRKLMIILLMITGPVFITLSIYPHMRQVTSTWGRELFSNIISQSIHAIMLWIFIVMSNTQQAWLLQVVFLATFIPLSEAIKSLLGASSETGKMATGSSIAAIAGAAAITGSLANATGANNVSNLMSKLASSGASNVSGGGYRPGPGVGPGPGSGRGASISGGAPSSNGYSPAASAYENSGLGMGTASPVNTPILTNSRPMNRALKVGRVMSKIGATTGAVLGATAMAPLGPMGMALGASAGANVLSSTGAVLGRSGWQAGETGLKGIRGGVKSVYEGFKPGGAISQAGAEMKPLGRKGAQIKSMVQELGKGSLNAMGVKGGVGNVARGAASHAAGTIFGEKGYNFTYGVADKALGSLSPSMNELKSKVDDQEFRKMKLIQTNEGSYLTAYSRADNYANRVRISRIGEGNPVLKPNESVEMKANFAPGGRLQFDHSTIEFRDANKQIRKTINERGKQVEDRDYARSKYTHVEPNALFKEKYPDHTTRRNQRASHSDWIQKNSFGGKG